MLEDSLYRHRPSRDATFQQDVEETLSLVLARPDARVDDFPALNDLQELWQTPDTRANTQLWEDQNGRVVGFVVVDPTYNQLIFEIRQGTDYAQIGAEMIAWGATVLAEADSDAIRSNCRADNHERISLLTGQGFVADSFVNLHFARQLSEPIPEPQLPPGFTIHHVTDEGDVERMVELHQAAFGTQNMTIDYRLAMMRVPEYDPTLDLIAVAPDGKWVSFCMGSISEEENRQAGRKMGWLDPVGTHPDFRRRGLAQALLLTGMLRLKERGMKAVGTNTAESNAAMRRTAESVGFRETSRSTWYRKKIV